MPLPPESACEVGKRHSSHQHLASSPQASCTRYEGVHRNIAVTGVLERLGQLAQRSQTSVEFSSMGLD